LNISVDMVKELREQCGLGLMECRKILLEVDGDMAKAVEILKQKNIYKAEKKSKRITSSGLVEAYVHTGGRVGAMIELNCETDFAAHTDEFKALAHDLAMQVAAMTPQFISSEEVPEDADIEVQAACLLLQPFIKNTDMTVQDIINETIARVGENIRVGRFARFEAGEQ